MFRGMAAVNLVYAHPYPDRSRANRVLLDALRDVDEVEIRSLYDLYPDFAIDVAEEQAALLRAGAVVFQHPMYWYSVPGLLKHWFDKVLQRGWAYGAAGTKLHGKRCLWAYTTGGDDHAFSPEGMHAHRLVDFTHPVEQTARFCGMRWEDPVVVLGAHRIEPAQLEAKAQTYRDRILSLVRAVEEDGR